MRGRIPTSVCALLCSASLVAGIARAEPGAFSKSGLAGWEAQTFSSHKPTRYQLITDAGTPVLQADCDDSASGYLHRESIDLTRTPVLSWRWRVEGVYKNLHEQEKSGDDFAGRVYVISDGGWMPWLTRYMVYVWSNGETDARDWVSIHTRQAHVIALHSGADGAGQWQQEHRDVRADFKTFFGVNLDHVDVVALMTDCDDGHGRGRAWYGDLGYSPGVVLRK